MAIEDKSAVIVDHNTIFPASRPGLKTGLGFLALIAFVFFCIYLPQIKIMLGMV